MPISAVSQFPSNNSLSSRMLPSTLKPVKLPHPSLGSQSVRSTIPVASSAFRRSSRCATSGHNSHNPPVCTVYSHGLPSSLSLWSDCAMPRTEGPNTLARPKHTKTNLSPPIVPRFPPINCSSSSLSLPRFQISSVAPGAISSFGCQFYRPSFALLHTRMLDYCLTFFVWTLLMIPAPTHSLIVCTNRNNRMHTQIAISQLFHYLYHPA